MDKFKLKIYRGTEANLYSLKGLPGEIITTESGVYVYNDGWILMKSSLNDTEKTLTPLTCPNCGAPMNPISHKCEYCGTYFR